MTAPAAGTIALTAATTPFLTTPPLPQLRVHPFFNRGGGGSSYEPTLSITKCGFSLYPNEKHVLLTDVEPIYHAVIDAAPLKIDTKQPLRLAYSVSLKIQGSVLTVGPETQLALLLKTGCLYVDTVVLTQEQMDSMLSMKIPPPTGEPLPPPAKKGRLVIDLNH
jgi:hypothetical protein